ncbi:hypothetical protein GCM10027613_24510 [Microlunatus endophyticus]
MMIEELSVGTAVTPTEDVAMLRALELAGSADFRRRGGNPRVGCVVLAPDGTTIAEDIIVARERPMPKLSRWPWRETVPAARLWS